MNVDTDQVDRIVRDVMQRLLSMDSVAPSHGIAARRRAPTPPAVPPQANADEVAAAQTLFLTDRVVTMASLADRMVGVQRVEVVSGAIVTPLVADTLREQGIRLEWRSANVLDGAALVDPSIVLIADAVQTQRVATLLDQFAGRWQSRSAGDDALSQIARAGANRRTIVLTPEWASIVCGANRYQHLRAAAANSVSTVHQACQQADINVLVIDSTQLTDAQLHDLVRQYLDQVRRAAACA
jgi:hypothetical protein